MKARKYIFNRLPNLEWIAIEDWKKLPISKESCWPVVVAFASGDGVEVTHGWSRPSEDHSRFDHCRVAKLRHAPRIPDEDMIAVSLLDGFML